MEGSGYSNSSTSHKNTEAILSKHQIKSSAQGQKLMTRQMEKLKSLSKWVSHAPAAEAWDAGTHIPSLEVSNPFPVSEFPQNSNSRLLVPAEHTDSAVLRIAEVLTKSDPYKRETRTSQGPKEQAPSARSQGRSTAPEAAAQWCPEGQPGMLRTKINTSALLMGQLRVLWLIMRTKMTEWRPSQRDSVLTTQSYWSRSWGEVVSSIFLLFLVGCICLLLLTTAWRYLDAGLLWACLKGIWGWTEIIWLELLSRLHRYLFKTLFCHMKRNKIFHSTTPA